jgi:hypothetical protein
MNLELLAEQLLVRHCYVPSLRSVIALTIRNGST